MKTHLPALALIIFTALIAALIPYGKSIADGKNQILQKPTSEIPKTEQRAIDLVFVLDTTSSMSGMIQAAKDKIWSIASTMANSPDQPEIRIGLVAFRDRKDEYVTKTINLTTDLDSTFATLMNFKAQGGGDGPESVNKGLYDAVTKMDWRQDQDTYKVIFLVGDAPGHKYLDEIQYPAIVEMAKAKGIIINSIQCGQNRQTAQQFQQIAALSQGDYFSVEQNGSAIASATPYDEEIASLTRELDGTKIFYGDKEEKKIFQRKQEAIKEIYEKSSASDMAKRGAFNASKSGEKNLGGSHDLISELESGNITVEEIKKENLPAPIQKLSEEDRQKQINETLAKRKEIKQKIEKLNQDRQVFIREEIAESEELADSLDSKLYKTLRSQAGKRGIGLSESGPIY